MITLRSGGTIRALALAASSVILATACGGGATPAPSTGTTSGSSSAPTTAPITSASAPVASGGTPVVWIFAGPEGDALKAAGDAYTKATGKPVDVEVLGRDTFNQKRDLFVASQATGVDLIMTGSSRVPSWADGSLIAPVEQYINADPKYNWESDVF